MKTILIAFALLLCACKPRPPAVWNGIPAGARMCSGWRDYTATCIVQGAAYRCISDYHGNVECARESSAEPAERTP